MNKCLVVDDVEVTLFATKKALNAIGLGFTCVNTAEEAFAALKEDFYDLVLLDWHLGKKSGLDVLKAIKAEYGARIKIVMCSGIEGADKAAEAITAGADAFLEKPTTPEKIKSCLAGLG